MQFRCNNFRCNLGVVKIVLKQIKVIFTTFAVGWGWGWGWCGEVEIKAISASNRVEVEAELGNNNNNGSLKEHQMIFIVHN